jgi:hypothetical protein
MFPVPNSCTSGYAWLNPSKRAAHDCVAIYWQLTNVRRMFWNQCLCLYLYSQTRYRNETKRYPMFSIGAKWQHQCEVWRYHDVATQPPPPRGKGRLTRCSPSSLRQGHTACVKASLSERPSFIRSFRVYSVFSTANGFAQLTWAGTNTRVTKIPVSQRGRKSKLRGDAQPPDFIFIIRDWYDAQFETEHTVFN